MKEILSTPFKRILAIVLSMFMCAALWPTQTVFADSQFAVGDHLEVGKYTWTVVEQDGDELTLFADQNVATMRYSEISCMWRGSEIYEFLNREFYQSLPADVQKRIRLKKINSGFVDYKWYWEPSSAKIYIASQEDIEKIKKELGTQAVMGSEDYWLRTKIYSDKMQALSAKKSGIGYEKRNTRYDRLGVRPMLTITMKGQEILGSGTEIDPFRFFWPEEEIRRQKEESVINPPSNPEISFPGNDGTGNITPEEDKTETNEKDDILQNGGAEKPLPPKQPNGALGESQPNVTVPEENVGTDNTSPSEGDNKEESDLEQPEGDTAAKPGLGADQNEDSLPPEGTEFPGAGSLDEMVTPEIPALDEEETYLYTISVKTGSELYGTRAFDQYSKEDFNVSLYLEGSNKESAPILINPFSGGSEKPQEGEVTTYTVKSADVGAIQSLKLVSSKPNAKADWYVDNIGIYLEDEEGRPLDSNFFQVRNWVIGGGEYIVAPSFRYDFEVTTGDVAFAGTDSNIYMSLIDKDGNSTSETHADSFVKGNAFERNSTNRFSAFFNENIGEIDGITIRSDCSLLGSDWFVDTIKVSKYSEYGNTVVKTFPIKEWIADKEPKTFGNARSNNAQYRITVKTGDVKDAGTDSNIYIKLVGTNGTTEEKEISNQVWGNAFERNQEDSVVISLNSGERNIGTVKGIMLRSDCKWAGYGWYPEWIRVQPITGGVEGEGQTLNIKQWIDDEGTHYFTNDPSQSSLYRVTVKTGTPTGAGTDSNITLRLAGTKGESGSVVINPSFSGNAFESGSTDTAIVDFGKNIGELKNLYLQSDCKWAGSDWFVESIAIEPICNGEAQPGGQTFVMNQWIVDKAEKTFGLTANTSAQYRITVKTGDISGGGTDSNIYLQIRGTNGITEEREISNLVSGNAFERNSQDSLIATFQQNAGTVQSIALRSDCKWAGSDWYVDWLKIETIVNGVPQDEQVISINQWIKDTQTKIFSTDEMKKKQYRVSVKTGNPLGAGTDCANYIRLSGTEGETNMVNLNPYMSGNAFEKGDLDVADITFDKNVGELKDIIVKTDWNAAKGGDWNIEWIKIEPLSSTGQVEASVIFRANQWLINSEEVTFTVDPEKIVQYQFKIKTGNKLFAGTDDNIFISLIGEDGRTTKEVDISEAISGNALEKGNTDVCTITFDKPIGSLSRFVIRSNRKYGDDWYFESIQVQPMLNGQAYGSPKSRTVNNWIKTKTPLNNPLT